MKNKIILIVKLFFILLLLILPSFISVFAGNEVDIPNLLSGLNLDNIEEIFSNLSKTEQDLLGGSFKNLLTNLANGTDTITNNFLPYGINMILSTAKNVLPGFTLLLGVILLTTIFNGIKSDFANKSVSNVINFASACIIGVVLCYSVIDTAKSCYKFVKNVYSLTQAVFPIIFSILITMGAGTTASVFQGSMAVFLSILSMIITAFVMPIILTSSILSVLTSISSSLNLSKIPTFMSSLAKKTLNVLFIVFSSLLALQGISSQVYDSVGIRIAKFSLNKYVPIIGGYISSGFDVLYAGSVLLKNSVGIAFVFLLIINAIPLLIRLIFMKLLIELLTLASSITGNTGTVNMLNGIKHNFSLITTCISGLLITLSVFAVITVLSFNSIL